jgi:hypothetical protein
MAIERFQDKNGRTRYKDTNTGRFAKLSSWSRQEATRISPDQFAALGKKEKQSIKANQRIRNNGKFIDKRQEKRIKSTLEKTGQKLQNNDIFKTFGKEAAQNLLRDTFTRWVNSDAKNQFNVDNEIIKALKQGLGFTFIHEGKTYIGMDGLFKLKEIEAKIHAETKKRKEPIYPLLYLIREDTEGNLKIDSSETQVIPNEPKKR